MKRYRCKSRSKIFRDLTGTSLSGLHRKNRWLAFGSSLAEREPVRKSAQRCGIANSAAFRWRHRFLKAASQAPDQLSGIVEADETFVREGRKGQRDLVRYPCRHGGTAKKRGLSSEQVPILVATDRTGSTLCRKMPALNAKEMKAILVPVIAKDALLVSDANRCYPPVAKALGIQHERINRSAGRGFAALFTFRRSIAVTTR